MRRRDLFALAGFLALQPLAGKAQTGRVRRIGFLDGGPAAARQPMFDSFRRGMAELGYIEGTNLVYDRRHAEGQFTYLPDLARELISLSPDAMLVATTPAAVVAKEATSSLPI